MMLLGRVITFTVLFSLYVVVFNFQDNFANDNEGTLEFSLSPGFYKGAAGYLQQLVTEILFVKVSVFLGGVKSSKFAPNYAAALSNNFEVISEIYPEFIDTYYFTQSFLAPISPIYAEKANHILEKGIQAYPKDTILQFFRASNFFLVMNQPLLASQAFQEAAKIPNAPLMFGHLAALLSAKGGDIVAGLMSLKALEANEKNEYVRQRYLEEIACFEEAEKVQNAVNLYSARNGYPPNELDLLKPDFIQNLPSCKNRFIIKYTPPTVHLERPKVRIESSSE